jgi:hypothetical protein
MKNLMPTTTNDFSVMTLSLESFIVVLDMGSSTRKLKDLQQQHHHKKRALGAAKK